MSIIIHQYFNDDPLSAINLGSVSRLDVDRYFFLQKLTIKEQRFLGFLIYFCYAIKHSKEELGNVEKISRSNTYDSVVTASTLQD